MRLVLDQPAGVAAWVAGQIPYMDGGDFGPCHAIGVVGDDFRLLGGVVFSNYQPRYCSVEVSFAASTPRWLTRNLLKGIMAYPFDQLGCQRITSVTPKKNRRAREFIDRFGFKREGVVRRGFGDDDAVISGLMRHEWLRSRWHGSQPLTGVSAGADLGRAA